MVVNLKFAAVPPPTTQQQVLWLNGRVLAGDGGCAPNARSQTVGPDNNGYLFYVSLVLQEEESDRLVARVEGKHDFF